MTSERALKRNSLPLLVTILSADALVLFLALNNFDLPDKPDWRFLGSRALISFIVPPVALLLAGLLPPAAKDVLVFWRLKHTLPGHRAFTEGTLRDPRVDVQKLSRNITVGFPAEAREQNAVWYRLFKKVEADPAIHQANRSFLLHREVAAISAIVALAAGAAWLTVSTWRQFAGWVLLIFAIQYVAAAINSANYGRRLVTSVLAAHSVKRRV